MVGLGRGDLFLRGSRLWSCGKCGFARNFTNRCKCLECKERPPQWIIDAQTAKAKELAKQPAKSDADGGRGGKPKPNANQAKSEKTELEKEVERLRAENSRLKQGASGPPVEATPEVVQGSDADDAEYQATIDDLEGQLAVLRKLARESRDASLVSAWIENLEKKADAVRAERRAGWSVPRLLDRQRSRVAEREARVAKAQARVEELEAAKAQVCADLEEASAHLAAKQEDLYVEKMECEKLEKQLPEAKACTAVGPVAAKGFIDLDAPDAEEMAVAVLRRMSARKGGAWGDLLAAVAPAAPAAAAAAAACPLGAQQPEQSRSADMEVEGQNALVPSLEALVADPCGGQALSLVPTLGKRSPTSAASASAAKRCK